MDRVLFLANAAVAYESAAVELGKARVRDPFLTDKDIVVCW
jgi:hypothetical protein